jgi:hypothetical protein
LNRIASHRIHTCSYSSHALLSFSFSFSFLFRVLAGVVKSVYGFEEDTEYLGEADEAEDNESSNLELAIQGTEDEDDESQL